MNIDEYYNELFYGDLASPAHHLEDCEDGDCEVCNYLLLEFFTACDGCGHWMDKECVGGYFYNPDTGHTYCMSCEEKYAPIV